MFLIKTTEVRGDVMKGSAYTVIPLWTNYGHQTVSLPILEQDNLPKTKEKRLLHQELEQEWWENSNGSIVGMTCQT